jgi:hypothetical protein
MPLQTRSAGDIEKNRERVIIDRKRKEISSRRIKEEIGFIAGANH